jgi:3-oxoacyl-[acyl-carrier-protein] synthase-3
MIVGFEGLASGVPRERVPVAELAAAAGHEEAVAVRLGGQGLFSIPVADDLRQVCGMALHGLGLEDGYLRNRVSGIVFAHSVARPFTMGDNWFDLFDNAGLASVPRFALSGQPCSVMHFAVQLAVRWLSGLPPDSLILVLGADVAETVEDRFFFNSVMGDSAMAGLIGNHAQGDHILGTQSRSRLYGFQGEDSPGEAISKFRAASPSNLRSTINQCLRKAGVRLTDIAYVAPHTPYREMWEIMSKFLGIPISKILLDYMDRTGHLNANDSFYHYWQASNDGRVKKGDLVLLVNPGFGGTWGCTLIRR